MIIEQNRKGTDSSPWELRDSVVSGQTNKLMMRIQCRLSEKTTKNTNTVGWHINSRWIDVVKKEVRSADLQIKMKIS